MSRCSLTPLGKVGPNLSERQWGTVREDYSQSGDAWNYFTHDQARSRAYHWGEDGMGGISDDKQLLCLSVAIVEWHGRYSQRTHVRPNEQRGQSWRRRQRVLLLSRQHAHTFLHEASVQVSTSCLPYSDLIETNRRRNRGDMEYERLIPEPLTKIAILMSSWSRPSSLQRTS
jgi:hypothetical protein